MLTIIFTIILSIIAFWLLGATVKGSGFSKEYGWNFSKKQILVIPIAILIMLFGIVTTIGANRVGVLYDPFNGGVQSYLLGEGMKFKSPFSTVYQINTEMSELSFDDISVQTNDSQWVKAKLQIQVKIDKEQAFTYFKNYKDKNFNDISNILKNTTQKQLEAVSTQYNIMNILGDSRNDIVNKTLDNLKVEFAKDGIIIERLVLVDTDAGDTIETAIANEAAAKKNAEAAKYLKEKAQLEGEAQVITAQKTKESNDLVTQSLTGAILTKMYYEKWDGKLPTTMTGDSTILSIPAK